jgi:hypothetical protein
LTALLFFTAVPFGSASQVSDEHGQASEDHGQAFTEITGLMKLFGERDNVSFMKVGRVAMSMGKTFGKAAISDPWVRMVIKAFRKVSGVFILDYGECLESTKELIEDEIGKHLSPNNLAYSNKDGLEVIDEVFGTTSPDGETVSDLVIILHGQSVICIRGSLAATDVPRTVNRLKRQL